MRGDNPIAPPFWVLFIAAIAIIAKSCPSIGVYYYQSTPITKFFLMVSQPAGL
ncbi:hypothetical protein M441DRAFT_53989 [Trichoderma asperellum CBS 433.97]|uniref:Uncharacterized protein n=1 Tax=Trichoderma asperellum (strain ATCC 204424 / CBS 433.97 / NBRC 101777) TaxID=1042311 RepID=A0A2T3ZJB5_TRIA4|nr:hypothetical protein M441DRAFT_53989 [Trichoderma asperellum CBS 433.97]PTB44901.1 hypothetical protein M441DRAFT_53989 [Trichoderma asperellum CBS 433.97]